MLTIAIPILLGSDSADSSDSGVSERTQYYATAKNLMMSGADAMERLMTSYKARKVKEFWRGNSNFSDLALLYRGVHQVVHYLALESRQKFRQGTYL